MDKAYYDKDDIMKRYGCKKDKAYSIIRSIRHVNGGGTLSVGKVLPREVEYWEACRAGKMPQKEEARQ